MTLAGYNLEQQLVDARERERRAELHVQVVEMQRTKEDVIDSHPDLSSATKQVFKHAIRMHKGMRADGSEPLDFRLGDIEQKVAMSPDTIGKELRKLDKWGFLEYGTRKERVLIEDKEGNKKSVFNTIASLALLPASEHPEDILLPEKRNHGGVREVRRCDLCGSEELVEERRIVCKHCNNELFLERTDLNPPAAQFADEPEEIVEAEKHHDDIEPRTSSPVVESSVEVLTSEPEAKMQVVSSKATGNEPIITVANTCTHDHGPAPKQPCMCGHRIYYYNHLKEQWMCNWCQSLTGIKGKVVQE
jgi:hypothetical protein